MEIKVKKTTYKVDGIDEPCFEVSNDYGIMVRIATCYHYFGNNTLYLTSYDNGEYNSSDEWVGDFKSLTKDMARDIAQKFCVYLNPIKF